MCHLHLILPLSLIFVATVGSWFTPTSTAYIFHYKHHTTLTIRRHNTLGLTLSRSGVGGVRWGRATNVLKAPMWTYRMVTPVKLSGTGRDGDEDDMFDLEDLRRRMSEQRQLEEEEEQQQQQQHQQQQQQQQPPDIEMFTTSPSSLSSSSMENKPKDVHIVVYNPDTEEQGVHTLEVPKGSGINFILAFESELECHSFCASLREQAFFDPKVQEIELAALEKHCESLPNVLAQLIPKGMNLKPPTEQVDELDMNPNRSVEVDFVDYLYRMSSSSGSEEGGAVDDSDGGALLSNDGDDYDGGDGGSWE